MVDDKPIWGRRRQGGYRFHRIFRRSGSNVFYLCDMIDHGIKQEHDLVTTDNPPERERCTVCAKA